MAPELIYTEEVNPFESIDPRAVDYWSLGCVLYEMITLGESLPFGDCNINKPEFRMAVVYDQPFTLNNEKYCRNWP